LERNNQMQEYIRSLILSKYYALSECSGWVFPAQVGARIETHVGSHVWQVPSEAEISAVTKIAEDILYDNDEMIDNPNVKSALEEFEASPSLEKLISVTTVIFKEKTIHESANQFSLYCQSCGHKKTIDSNFLKEISARLGARDELSTLDQIKDIIQFFKCSKCDQKNIRLIFNKL